MELYLLIYALEYHVNRICGNIILTFSASELILNDHAGPKSTQAKKPPSSRGSQSRTGSCTGPVVSGLIGVFRRSGQSSGPLRNASRSSSYTRWCQCNLSALWCQSSDLLQFQREVSSHGYCRATTAATWTERTIKTYRGSIILCRAAPRGGRVYFNATTVSASSHEVQSGPSSKNARKVYKKYTTKKKLLSNDARRGMEFGVSKGNADTLRVRYELLRRNYQNIAVKDESGDWEAFCLFGMNGLLQSSKSIPYIVEVYQAPLPRWCGKQDPQEKTLVEVFRQLASNPTQAALLN